MQFRRLFSKGFPIQKQFNDRRIGIDVDNDKPKEILSQIFPVPIGQDVKHGHIIAPLTLIKIIGIFRKAGSIQDTKVGTMWYRFSVCHRSRLQPIPWFRLTQVIKASPDKLSRDVIPLNRIQPGLPGCIAPFHTLRIIFGYLIRFLINSLCAIFSS